MKNFSNPEIIILDGDARETGQLHFLEYSESFPFKIKRSFWITDVPEGSKRGVHAHRKETQVLATLHGKVEVNLIDTSGKTYSFILDHPSKALVLPAMFWSEVIFGKGAVLLVLSNEEFSESDYIRDKKEFDALS